MVPVDDEDGDTTAAHTAPAVGATRDPSAPEASRTPDGVPLAGDADDATVQRLPDERGVVPEVDRETAPVARGQAGVARAARRPMMTLLGTGPSRGSEHDEDEEHESVTERAKLGVRVSASGAIHEVSVARGGASRGPKPARRSTSDGLDDSEERALVSRVGRAAQPHRPFERPRPPAPTLLDPSPPPSSPFSAAEPSRDAFDPPTAEAFDPPTAENVITSAPSTSTPAVDDLYSDESITTRGPPISEDEDEDGVTTRALVHPSTRLPVVTAPAARPSGSTPSHPAIRAPSGVVVAKAPVPLPSPVTPQAFPADATEGTTKKLVAAVLPSEDEADSVTTQAPGHLTNMLRVIAASSSPPIDDEDAEPENRTAVMPNRPYSSGGSGSIAAAPGSSRGGFPSPVYPHLAMPVGAARPSESALRVAEPAPAPIDHASLGVLEVPMRPPNDAALAPPFVRAAPGHGSSSGHAHLAQAKPPSYAVLVAVVAALSVGVPIGVFYVLRAQAPETPSMREGHQVTSEVVRLSDPPRPKAGGSRASSSAGKRR